MLRPVQLRADAEDGTFMVPGAMSAHDRYGELKNLPLLLVAGADDRVVDPDAQSGRLHRELPHSTFIKVKDAGHMVHYDSEVRARVIEAAKLETTTAPTAKQMPVRAAN